MKNETDTSKNMLLFQERLKELRGNNKLQDIAKNIGISRASLGYYENGDRKPDIEVLLKLANYYHVSCDYLLGLTDTRSPDINDRIISQKLGLNEQSVITLTNFKQKSITEPEYAFDTTQAVSTIYLESLNRLLNPECKILTNIMYYLYINFDAFYDDYTYKGEDLYAHISELGLFDTRLGIEYSDSFNYLPQIFLLKVQNELTKLRETVQQDLPERMTPVVLSNDFYDETDDNNDEDENDEDEDSFL